MSIQLLKAKPAFPVQQASLKIFRRGENPSCKPSGNSSEYDAIEQTLAASSFNRYLDQLPWDGDSRNHNKAHNAFLRAASLHIPSSIALANVELRIRTAGGIVDTSDLSQQLKRAYEYVGRHGIATIPAAKHHAPIVFSPERLDALATRVQIEDPVEFIRQRSACEPSTVTPEEFLNRLYLNTERIVIFTDQNSQGQFVFTVGQDHSDAIPRSGSEGVWYLIQPVDGHWHVNQGGNKSRRSKESITSWRYMLLESDEAGQEQWLRLLIQLPLKIVAIYTSGGRSIHALVRIDADSKDHWDSCRERIKKVMAPLGADAKALTAVRLSRLPQCLRGKRMQELLYLNPDADASPIFLRPARPANSFKEGCANVR